MDAALVIFFDAKIIIFNLPISCSVIVISTNDLTTVVCKVNSLK